MNKKEIKRREEKEENNKKKRKNRQKLGRMVAPVHRKKGSRVYRLQPGCP